MEVFKSSNTVEFSHKFFLESKSTVPVNADKLGHSSCSCQDGVQSICRTVEVRKVQGNIVS